MNVLHIDEQRGWRGGEQQAAYLIRGLAERGHKNLVAGRRGSPFFEADFGIRDVMRIAAPFVNEADPMTIAKLAWTVREHKVDIIHAHTSHAMTVAWLARALARRGKVVASRRVDFPPKNHALNRWKYAQPDMIVAISDFIGGMMRDFGVPEERLAVVHSGIDPTRFDVEPLTRAELGVPEKVPLIGAVAALVGHKDHATLLNAMPIALAEIPDLHLVIAGEGELRPALENQIRQIKLGRSIRLLGYRRDVPQLLRALDAFVMSSKEEGLGTSVLDAMACGLPVAATAAGGIPETVRHEDTGLLAPVQDPEALAKCIIRLFHEPGLASTLAANARQLIHDHFTAQRMVEGNLKVYERLLGGQPCAAP